ncbi:DUF3445 domain-containing protein [Sutcliffiella cohnii]|uniref:heme-dependent oxidative N-demethylase family protein n=1 Tax=Sutcliffiella cohnii TaxID=33932 RepID=UPI002E211B04|nr:DUF3445 domain-containing protein [Sutcliffiella cohnii]
MKSLDHLAHFPYPFKDDTYRYSNNSVLLNQPCSVDITNTYEKEVFLKRELLTEHHERCFQSLPHTMRAQWEVVDLVIDHLVTYFPTKFSIDKAGEQWTFRNVLLDETVTFTFGDCSSLSVEPLDFIGRHVQEDLLLMMERDGDLYLDAGQLCFPSNWSLTFNVGMDFKTIHKPIPGFAPLDDRILTFLMQLEVGSPWGRKNWGLMAGDRLDTSLETFNDWGKGRKKVTKDNVGEFVHLRVEVQKLFRLPRTGGILFTIHSHIMPLYQFVMKKEWLQQFNEIMQELPPHIVDYKGITSYREPVLQYLKEQLESRGV